MSLPRRGCIDYLAAMGNEFSIAYCSAKDRAGALRLLHAGLSEDGQTALVQTLDGVQGHGESAFAGLLCAHRGGEPQAAVWAQLTPGRTALVWPSAGHHPASPLLIRAAAAFLDENDVALAQILVSPDAEINPHLFAMGQFHKLANLVYLTLENSHFPQVQPPGTLDFQPHADGQPERLGRLLQETYTDSLDCPALNGVHSTADIIDGYAAQGDLGGAGWYFVCNQPSTDAGHQPARNSTYPQEDARQQDVGALILASHGEGGSWELVYMGIVPAARGQGYGWQILQYALWQARLGKADRLVLAVDQSNEHVLRMYRRAGFIVWDRRTVYARFSGQTSVSSGSKEA
ncbi:MAG: GNAT family N-acetyltransferase [Pirellulales bacterium]|nr:GNAT family N-acetyltransferase [Pirellulales bacterium]